MPSDNWDVPTNWRERPIDPSSFAFITSVPFSTSHEVEEEAIIRCAQGLVWNLLLKRMDEIAKIFLTSHQQQVYELYFKNHHTYQEIGTILSAANRYSGDYSAYTAISHCIKGIKSNKHGGKYHGGIENRLRKRCEKDEPFQQLLLEWKFLQKEKIADSLDFLERHDKWYRENRATIEQELQH